jgi:hypothetical protein
LEHGGTISLIVIIDAEDVHGFMIVRCILLEDFMMVLMPSWNLEFEVEQFRWIM